MSNESHYWDNMAGYGRDASVIDPRDRLGRKNAYITASRTEILLQELATLPHGACVLDFGCGTGGITRTLLANGFHAIGVEISPALLKLGRESTTASPYVLFDGESIPLCDNAIDAAVTYVVLNHIMDNKDLARILAEIHRILRPGGRLLAIEQIRRRDHHDIARHSHRRSMDKFCNLFDDAGFTLDRRQTLRFGHFLPIYLIRYGLIPERADRIVAASERLLGRLHPVPWFDYADVLFVLTKPA